MGMSVSLGDAQGQDPLRWGCLCPPSPVVIWQQQKFVGTAGLRVPQPCSPQWCVTPRGGGPAGCWRAWHGLRGRHCYVTSSRAGGGRRRRKHSWASGLFQPGCSWGLPVARGCGCWMGSPWGWTPSHALGCWGWTWGNGKGWQVPDISGAAGRDGDSLMSNKGCALLPPCSSPCSAAPSRSWISQGL